MSRPGASPVTSVPEELRQTEVDLANAMAAARDGEDFHVPQSSARSAGGPAGDRSGVSVGEHPEHYTDSVPESLRHTSEVAAELANRVWNAVSEKLHLGHQARSRGDDQPEDRRGRS
ncbi:hypothetical protein GPECTOR_1g361 [Gonium pectorale]|uniref:Uncharacterized protein n=1 Tax=Gonium pectorale TaxID=33097 RepID=A0A150H2K5_GONPE|nr:hypothetical protein GPECTOR_1g361 [Gonium pectorale]|eukprot:KXZ56406.1 hypothetical protein GPECTOR_1g361 [Gonium pectorale]